MGQVGALYCESDEENDTAPSSLVPLYDGTEDTEDTVCGGSGRMGLSVGLEVGPLVGPQVGPHVRWDFGARWDLYSVLQMHATTTDLWTVLSTGTVLTGSP